MHGAAGWQTEPPRRAGSRSGISTTPPTRAARAPFIPLWTATRSACPQLPTTLPTLDELIGVDRADVAARTSSELTRSARENMSSRSRRARGREAAAASSRALLAGWNEQGYELVPPASARRIARPREPAAHEIALGAVPGRSGTLALQAHLPRERLFPGFKRRRIRTSGAAINLVRRRRPAAAAAARLSADARDLAQGRARAGARLHASSAPTCAATATREAARPARPFQLLQARDGAGPGRGHGARSATSDSSSSATTAAGASRTAWRATTAGACARSPCSTSRRR